MRALLNWKDVAGQGFDVDWFVNNLTDKDHISSSINAIANLGTVAAYQGAPRMYGLSVRIPLGGER